MLYYFGDQQRDQNLEDDPHAKASRVRLGPLALQADYTKLLGRRLGSELQFRVAVLGVHVCEDLGTFS